MSFSKPTGFGTLEGMNYLRTTSIIACSVITAWSMSACSGPGSNETTTTSSSGMGGSAGQSGQGGEAGGLLFDAGPTGGGGGGGIGSALIYASTDTNLY